MTEVTSETRVYIRHVRAAKICWPGVCNFFRKHNINPRDFARNGIPVSRLQEIGDPNGLRTADEALKESGDGR